MTQTILIITIIAISVLLGGVVILLVITKRKKYKGLDRFFIEEKIENINKLINQKHSTAYSLAIVEADKLLDTLLKMRHVPGTTLGERLKHIGYDHPQLRAVWPAHNMRNKIVHEHIDDLTANQVQHYWKLYQAAYRILSR